MDWGNFRIFLPFRIYVKSILVSLKPSKTAILTIWETVNFEFLRSFDIFKCGILPKIKIQSLQNCWNSIFWPSEITWNWFHIKSEWQENCYILTLRNIYNQKFPTRLPRSVVLPEIVWLGVVVALPIWITAFFCLSFSTNWFIFVRPAISSNFFSSSMASISQFTNWIMRRKSQVHGKICMRSMFCHVNKNCFPLVGEIRTGLKKYRRQLKVWN